MEHLGIPDRLTLTMVVEKAKDLFDVGIRGEVYDPVRPRA
ncbi:MAG: hypothetical protein NVSMB5_27280 [Candidatus Velthaea sp.]